jgi:hypothetical protein
MRVGLRRDSLGTKQKQVAYQQPSSALLQNKIAAKPHVLPRNRAQLFSLPRLAPTCEICDGFTILVKHSSRIALNS